MAAPPPSALGPDTSLTFELAAGGLWHWGVKGGGVGGGWGGGEEGCLFTYTCIAPEDTARENFFFFFFFLHFIIPFGK